MRRGTAGAAVGLLAVLLLSTCGPWAAGECWQPLGRSFETLEQAAAACGEMGRSEGYCRVERCGDHTMVSTWSAMGRSDEYFDASGRLVAVADTEDSYCTDGTLTWVHGRIPPCERAQGGGQDPWRQDCTRPLGDALHYLDWRREEAVDWCSQQGGDTASMLECTVSTCGEHTVVEINDYTQQRGHWGRWYFDATGRLAHVCESFEFPPWCPNGESDQADLTYGEHPEGCEVAR